MRDGVPHGRWRFTQGPTSSVKASNIVLLVKEVRSTIRGPNGKSELEYVN